jgi:uncharacterized membrane protein YfhO
MEQTNILDAMASPDFDPWQVALVSERSLQGAYATAETDSIRWVVDEPDRLALDTWSSGKSFLVITDTFFPGWQASLDGVQCMIHRVNYLVRGVSVPQGHHTLEMVYRPEGWREGVLVTRLAGVAWIILVSGAVVMGLRSHRLGRKVS